ncbi:glycoside hydrolase [Candidatus Galacturonibacter soehngenii]|uniref:Glycoside hydrolase n=1 Tax=Candidatus Galacturonatibacter soehngenii TaxID=2307010 RepID=A0A7V7QP07_9FIRM|nr:glycoside hydrolase [Candidatus Galacturonibacter soehngenii]KAB1441036.1 glycoside hydrolase [Candidatus Galacturonibacter soehngenii]
MKKIQQILQNKYDNHIFPFLWMHGEDEVVIREYMKQIEQSGIKAVCIEARPHPDFLGKKWWADMDCILEEAKKRNMKVWILDDSHFPTGYANGEIKKSYPHLKKRFLKLYQLEFVGPIQNAKAIIKYAFQDDNDELVGVILGKKNSYQEVDASTLINITHLVKENKTLDLDLGEGVWKVMVLVATYHGGEKQTEDYLNPIDPEATDVLIHTVYEAHYQRYKEEFGNTIQGFFSDEPRFGNVHGALSSIGRNEMVLPWRNDMLEQMDQKMGESSLIYLPLLFVDAGEKAHKVRYAYMDLVSDLYSKHFSQRIGAWCEAHKVSYIGHTIEDNNAHARLGYGAGHFFKAMKGQHMAGIDVVLHQLLPGMDHGYFKSMTSSGWDGEFFHYVLGKLGSSLGHLDENKKGKVMCEVFGAYGWAEGIRMMKWITDYMLVRGVNEFVPHSFTLKEYPDPDCPPHFYAHGHNPQFKEFKILMEYMNRLSELFSDGIHRAPIGLLYHGEAEWAGEYMLMQKPAALLTRNQIDFDILPIEAILKSFVNELGVAIHKEVFQGLVIPYSQALPNDLLHKLLAIAKEGHKIYFIDALPERESMGEDITPFLFACEKETNIKVIPLEKLVTTIKEDGLFDISTTSYEPYLRYYQYEHNNETIVMFTNEHPYQTINTKVIVPFTKPCYQYDAFSNALHSNILLQKEKEGRSISLSLEAYESKVFVFSEEEYNCKEHQDLTLVKEEILKGNVEVDLLKAKSYPQVYASEKIDRFGSRMKQSLDDFAGIMRYETLFELNEIPSALKLRIEGIYETAHVYINGMDGGSKICGPYCFDVSQIVKKGINTLVIEVTTTLVRENYDWLSQFMLIEPIGINGDVILEYYKE